MVITFGNLQKQWYTITALLIRTCIIPTWYRASAQHSTIINIATRPCSMIRAGAVKINAIFLPVISIVVQFIVPSAS